MMKEVKKVEGAQNARSFENVLIEKQSALQDLVISYGGIMVGNPSAEDISALARFQARDEMGDQLSEDEEAQASRLASKFKGDFC